MYVCICVFARVYFYVCGYVCVCISVCDICVFVCVCISVCDICVFVCVCIFVCDICVFVCVCIYVCDICVFVCVCISACDICSAVGIFRVPSTLAMMPLWLPVARMELNNSMHNWYTAPTDTSVETVNISDYALFMCV